MYVDDSGDPGTRNSPSKHFALTGIIIHESYWKTFIDNTISFRRHLKNIKGLKLKQEIHSSEFISRKTKLHISPSQRYDILRQTIRWISNQNGISIISVIVEKQNHINDDIFDLAWTALIQRFENTIRHKNFPNSSAYDDKGMIISDETDQKKLKSILRRMRRFNFVPNKIASHGSGYRPLLIDLIIEDPNYRQSVNSYILQLVDVCVYFLRQQYQPNKSIRVKGGKNLYSKLTPVLQLKASSKNPLGIVYL